MQTRSPRRFGLNWEFKSVSEKDCGTPVLKVICAERTGQPSQAIAPRRLAGGWLTDESSS